MARWAPSGDNTQNWWFEPVDERCVRVHGYDTREHCVYDLDGRPSRLSIGALLETIRIAASSFALRARIERDRAAPEAAPVFDVRLEPEVGLQTDPLVAAIESRSVQRRPLSRRPLTAAEKQALEAAVGADYEIRWFEGGERTRLAKLMFDSARIRLTIEEAYRVHAAVIEWRTTHSVDRMPDAAVGADPLTLVIMRWVMRSWPRNRLVTRYLGGTLAPRLQMDLIPGIRCAAHVALLTRGQRAAGIDGDFADGAAMQRFWLTAESLGLRHQPELTPLLFARYATEGRRFTTDEAALRAAQDVARRLDALMCAEQRARTVWIGRIGAGPRAKARSLRLPLERLLVPRG